MIFFFLKLGEMYKENKKIIQEKDQERGKQDGKVEMK